MPQTLALVSDEEFKRIVCESSTWKDVLSKCGYSCPSQLSSRPPVKRRMEELNISYGHIMDRPRKRITLLSDKEFKDLVNKSTSWPELLTTLGYKDQYDKRMAKSRMKKMNLSFDHLARTLQPVANLKSKKRSSDVLKRLLRESGRPYICEWCRCEHMTFNEGEWCWNGEPVALHVDHIQGRSVGGSDELWNLRYLCPNCHSQTHNHPSRQTFEHSCAITSKRRLLGSHKPYVCRACNCEKYDFQNGIYFWYDWPIKLECNHINGRRIPDADHVDNLEWLCVNCHYQHTAKHKKQRLIEGKQAKENEDK